MDYRDLYENIKENTAPDLMDFFDRQMYDIWDQEEIDAKEAELKSQYPGKEREVDEIIELAGDISNTHDELRYMAEQDPEYKGLNSEIDGMLSNLVAKINSLGD